MRFLGVVISALVLAAPCLAQDPEVLTKRVAELEAEREALVVKLAQAKLKISELEAKLAQMGSSEPTAAPDARPDTGSTTLTVKVLSITRPDTTALRSELEMRTSELATLDDKLADARRRVDRLDYYRRHDRSRYSEDAMGDARALVTRTTSQRGGIRGQIARLNAQLKEKQSTRMITAQDVETGENVTMVASGPLALVADSMQREQQYTVEGIRRVVLGGTRIELRKIVAK